MLIGALSVCVALAAGVNAAANVWRATQPERVLHLNARDHLALMRQADRQLAGVSGPIVDLRQLPLIARRALAAEPLQTPALRLLALSAGGDVASARRSMTLAHQVSRRDVGTQLWLIEDSARQGNLKSTLALYDESLLVGGGLSDILLPILSSGLSVREIRSGLVPYVRGGHQWVPTFLSYAATKGNAAEGAAQLLISAGGSRNGPAVASLDAQILTGLLSLGNFTLAQEYLTYMTSVGVVYAREIGFSVGSTNPDLGPLAWSFTDDPDVGAQLEAGQSIRIRVSPEQHGTVAQRVMLLMPGTYEFLQRVEFPPLATSAQTVWEWRCRASGDVIWSQAVPIRTSEATYSSRIVVPLRCGAVQVKLSVRGGDGQGEAEIVIGGLRLVRGA
jgi:hypothetical protein